MPLGGEVVASHSYGFNQFYEQGSYANNDLAWNVTDINGDSKPDIIVTAQGDGTYNDIFGNGTSPYWKVYLNNGSGFSSSPTNWSVPLGGEVVASHSYGFHLMYGQGSYVNNDLAWSVLDMNGDGKQDLVVSAQGDGTYDDVFGNGTSPYWKVYLNNGSGFSSSPTNWSVPLGGEVVASHSYGFNQFYEQGSYANNDLAWNVTDINGDSKPDIIVTAQGDGTYNDIFGNGTSPYWKVYLNNGSGFSSSPTNWSVPLGGEVVASHSYGFHLMYGQGSYANNDLAWSALDMNGDHTIDLVVTAQGDGTNEDVFGNGTSPYWKVYLNTSPTTGIKENKPKNDNTFLVYPNPFNSIVQLEINQELNETNKQLEIYNLLGEIVFTSEIKSSESKIDLGKKSNGIYFIKIGSEIKKIIKE